MNAANGVSASMIAALATFQAKRRAFVFGHLDSGLRGPSLVAAITEAGYYREDEFQFPHFLTLESILALPDEWFQERLSTDSLPNGMDVFQTFKGVRERNRRYVTESEKLSAVSECERIIWGQVNGLRQKDGRGLQEADREDAYQQCVVAVLMAYRRWDRRAEFTTYAWPWITRAVLDWQKSRRFPPGERNDATGGNTEGDPAGWLVLMDTLQEVLDSEMVVLTAMGYSDREIALLVTGNPDTNIRMRKSRAKTKLAKGFNEAGFIHAPRSPKADNRSQYRGSS